MKTLNKKPNPTRNLRSGILWITLALTGLFVILLISGGGLAYAAHQEEKDVFCASCHTQPEATFYERTQSPTQIDLASFHHSKDTRCIDCHSGKGIVGRSSAMMLGASDLFHYLTSTAKQPAPLTVPIEDGNCLKCHAEVLNTQDFNRHFHVLLPRWQAIDQTAATCVDCHSSHTPNGQANLAFLETSGTRLVCDHCHSAAGG